VSHLASGSQDDLLLLCRSGSRRFAVHASAVVRVHLAVQFIALDGMGAHVAGVVNVAGEHLPLVSAALAFGEGQAELSGAQRFVEVHVQTRWLLWVDEVEGMLRANADQFDALKTPDDAPVRFVLRLPQANASVPLLNLLSLEPGAVVSRGGR
jgi:chemotaxis signal transduction protein